jgi:hypothetical protein
MAAIPGEKAKRRILRRFRPRRARCLQTFRAIAHAHGLLNSPEIRLTSDFCLEREMTLTETFAVLPDPRTEPVQRRDLREMILVALCAVLCGADTWGDVAEWAEDNEEGLAPCR